MSGYGVAVAAVAFIIVVVNLSQPSKFFKLDAIPTVGSNGWLGSYWGGLKFLSSAIDILQEGYEKHKSAPFKVAELYHWVIVLGSRKHLEEIRRAPDDVLSILEAIKDFLQVEYTLGPQIHYNPYHVPIAHSQVTRNIGALYPEIRDEVIAAFDDMLDLKSSEWKSIPALSSVHKVVCRTSNRMFVGLPLCRDPDWVDLNIQYTLDVVKGGAIIGLFPNLLKPIAARLFTNIDQSNERGRKLLGPIIEERQRFLNEYRDGWTDKPNDFLSWLMDEAEGPESTMESLTTRILVMNFSAIHATSHSFTHALLYLAANPQYIQPLREEVESIVEKEGWSKAAVGKMRKIDSFIMECLRLEGIASASLIRKAMKDFTFSDGTFVPKGTKIVTAVRSIHHDEAFYKNALEFEPFRFSDLREEDGQSMKHQLGSTTAEYLPFGYGRHMCPGRMFAAVEMKTMLAYVVVTYDIKLAGDATRPQSLHHWTAVIPNPSAEVMFRRRVD